MFYDDDYDELERGYVRRELWEDDARRHTLSVAF